MSFWDDVPDQSVPVTCPNCWEDYGDDFPLINSSLNVENIRLTLRIVLFGLCSNCGESVECHYSLIDEIEEQPKTHIN